MRVSQAALLLFAALPSCASSTGIGHARTLEDGAHDLAFGLEVNLASARMSQSRRVPSAWPQLALGYRRGFAGFELGARAWGFGVPSRLFTLGAAADVKLALVRAPSLDEGTDLSIGLDLGYHQVNVARAPTHVFFAQVPLNAGHNLGGGNQIIVGLRIADQLMTAPDVHPVNAFFVGGSVAFAWRALDFLEIRPEVVLLYSPVPFNGLVDEEGRRGLTLFQVGLNNALHL